MKKIFYFTCVTLFSVTAKAQNANATISEEFKQLSNEKGVATAGYEGITTFKDGSIKGNQFFYPEWVQGSVTTTNNEKIESKDYVYLFDKVRQVLFIKNNLNTNDNSGNNILTADLDKLRSFTLVTDKLHSFVKASDYDPTLKNNFFEVLVQNNNYTLLKLNTATFQKADEHDMLSMKNGDFSDAFVDHVTYYLYHNNKLEKANLQQYSLRKALKDQKTKVDDYFNMHQNDEMSEDLLVNLINYLNT